MASWISVYLQDTIEDLSVMAIQKGIDRADWLILGEQFNLEEEDVKIFMKSLKWFDSPSLQFGHDGKRPIQIYIRNEEKIVKEMINELIEENKLPVTVSKHLKNVKTIVDLEFGGEQLETMYEIIGFEIAYWLAETKNGLIHTPWDTWNDHGKYRWDIIK